MFDSSHQTKSHQTYVHELIEAGNKQKWQSHTENSKNALIVQWRFPFQDMRLVFNKNSGLWSIFIVPDVNHAQVKHWELETNNYTHYI